jgi:hypothetical protein
MARSPRPTRPPREGRQASSVTGIGAAAARDAFRAEVDAPGHAVQNVAAAVAHLKLAIERGDIAATPAITLMLADLHAAIAQDGDQKLGGKSAEAARFIARALARELDAQT